MKTKTSKRYREGLEALKAIKQQIEEQTISYIASGSEKHLNLLKEAQEVEVVLIKLIRDEVAKVQEDQPYYHP